MGTKHPCLICFFSLKRWVQMRARVSSSEREREKPKPSHTTHSNVGAKKKQSWGVQLCLSSTDFRTCFDSMLSWCVYHTPWQLRLCPNLSSLLHIKRHLHGTIHSLHLLSNLKAEFLRSWMKIITEIKYNLFQITEKQQTSILSPI